MKFRLVAGLALAFATLQGDDSQGARMMDLDVIAVDNHGQPVTDLTADDFQITDANKPQKIAFFRHQDSRRWQVPNLDPNEVSNRGRTGIPHATVILFDLLNEAFGTRGTAANQIQHCLSSLENPEDVYLYMLTLDGRLFGVHGLPGRDDVPEHEGAPWNKEVKPLMDKALKSVMQVRPVEIDVAARVQLTLRALSDLGAELSRVPGRKNVVWITDGVPILLGPARSDTGDFVDFTQDLRRLSDAMDRSHIALYPVRQLNVGTPNRIGDATGEGAGDPWTNPGPGANLGRGGGMGADTAGAGMQSLETLNTLADMTGGRQSTAKDVCGALKQARSDAGISYQMGYYPPESNWDGKYHKLRLTCKRKGVRIQAKTGYYAWTDRPGVGAEEAIHAAQATEFDSAEIGLHGSLLPDPKDQRRAQINVRIDARDITLTRTGDFFDGQMSFVWFGYPGDGRVESTPIMPLNVHYTAAERDRALNDGIALVQNVELGGQLVKGRLIVYDRGSNAVGALTLPIKLNTSK